jgi:predicted HNH restriction endonuclease
MTREHSTFNVDHLKPMALTDGESALDPIIDFRRVYSNCYAMLHRREEVLCIEELRVILTQLNTTA